MKKFLDNFVIAKFLNLWNTISRKNKMPEKIKTAIKSGAKNNKTLFILSKNIYFPLP